jgi:hypothetical protein
MLTKLLSYGKSFDMNAYVDGSLTAKRWRLLKVLVINTDVTPTLRRKILLTLVSTETPETLDVLKTLLDRGVLDVKVDDEIALRTAITHGLASVVKLLIDHGASIDNPRVQVLMPTITNQDIINILRPLVCSVCSEECPAGKICTLDKTHAMCRTCYRKWRRRRERYVNAYGVNVPQPVNCPLCRTNFELSPQ